MIKLDEQNYFQLFDIAPAFDIDKKQMSARYLNLLKRVHPDKFANATQQEKSLSAQYSAYINDAYECLSSELARGQYLLKLSGVEIDDQSITIKSPELLMKQIELREELQEIERSKQVADLLEKFIYKLEQDRNQVLSELSLCYDGAKILDLDAAKNKLAELQFSLKLQQETEQVEENLLDY